MSGEEKRWHAQPVTWGDIVSLAIGFVLGRFFWLALVWTLT